MRRCTSCGGDNPASAMRCQYCDQALVERKVVEVHWTARTRDGTTGRGTVRALAPVDAGADLLRRAAENAFSAALDDLGGAPGPEAVAAAMQRRLASALPPGVQLDDLAVEAVETFVLVGKPVGGAARPAAGAAGAPGPALAAAPRPGGRGVQWLFSAFGAFVVGSCCLLSGLLGTWVGLERRGEADAIRKAAVVLPADAAKTTGLVCLEGVVPRVAEPLSVPGVEGRWLFVVESVTPISTRTVTRTTHVDGKTTRLEEPRTVRGSAVRTERRVPRFEAGGLEVRPAGARFLGERTIGTVVVEADKETTRAGIPADATLTIVGEVHEGVLDRGAPFLIGVQPTRDALHAQVSSEASFGVCFGFGCSGVGALLLLVGLVKLRRR